MTKISSTPIIGVDLGDRKHVVCVLSQDDVYRFKSDRNMGLRAPNPRKLKAACCPSRYSSSKYGQKRANNYNNSKKLSQNQPNHQQLEVNFKITLDCLLMEGVSAKSDRAGG